MRASFGEFRQLGTELVTRLTFGAAESLATEAGEVETSLRIPGVMRFETPLPLIFPKIRSGFRILCGTPKLLPDADVGFLGIKRDEKTSQPDNCVNRLSHDLAGRQVSLIDPLSGKGRTLNDFFDCAFARVAADSTSICRLGASEEEASATKIQTRTCRQELDS